MPRFFITASNIFGGIAYLDAKDSEHIKVLRIKQGEKFTVCDGSGTDYVCQLSEKSEENGTTVEILEKKPSPGEPSVYCTVFAAYSKGDKMETVIQKCVELGASEIVAFPSNRCVSKPDTASVIKKTSRWQKIAAEAAKQSERGKIPTVSAASSYKEAIEKAAKADLPLFFYEEESELGFKSVLEASENVKTVSIVTGPEGGFDPEEAQFAVQSGMKSVTLGPRILRCETAPVAAISGVMLYTGNM